jgi:hypothetical protein
VCKNKFNFTLTDGHSLTDWFTHSLTLSLTQSLTPSLSHSLTHSLSHSLPHSVTHSLTLTQSLTHSHSVSQSVSQSVTHSLAQSVSKSVSQSVTHSLTHYVNDQRWCSLQNKRTGYVWFTSSPCPERLCRLPTLLPNGKVEHCALGWRWPLNPQTLTRKQGTVYCGMTPCSHVDEYQNWCLRLQCRRLILKTEVTCSSETSPIFLSHENLKTHTRTFSFIPFNALSQCRASIWDFAFNLKLAAKAP